MEEYLRNVGHWDSQVATVRDALPEQWKEQAENVARLTIVHHLHYIEHEEYDPVVIKYYDEDDLLRIIPHNYLSVIDQMLERAPMTQQLRQIIRSQANNDILLN